MQLEQTALDDNDSTESAVLEPVLLAIQEEETTILNQAISQLPFDPQIRTCLENGKRVIRIFNPKSSYGLT
jgi:hypothetical protein